MRFQSKLTSYRDLQKAGKELNADQRVAVAKYDEVSQTLEFARDLAKQMASIAVSAEREAKKQAKRVHICRHIYSYNARNLYLDISSEGTEIASRFEQNFMISIISYFATYNQPTTIYMYIGFIQRNI